jgi:hypothetical protein
MAPHLLLYPVLYEAEALAGIANRKLVHPTAQHWVDQLHNLIHWLRLVAAEHVLELPLQRSSFLELWRIVGTPEASTTAHAAEVEPQEAEALASTKIYDSTLLFIDLDLSSRIGCLMCRSAFNRVLIGISILRAINLDSYGRPS